MSVNNLSEENNVTVENIKNINLPEENNVSVQNINLPEENNVTVGNIKNIESLNEEDMKEICRCNLILFGKKYHYLLKNENELQNIQRLFKVYRPLIRNIKNLESPETQKVVNGLASLGMMEMMEDLTPTNYYWMERYYVYFYNHGFHQQKIPRFRTYPTTKSIWKDNNLKIFLKIMCIAEKEGNRIVVYQLLSKPYSIHYLPLEEFLDKKFVFDINYYEEIQEIEEENDLETLLFYCEK